MFTLLTALLPTVVRPRRDEHGDRGDVPGWVLITLMTAGIVAVLWGVAQGDFATLFDNAVKGVKGPSGN